MKLLIGSDLAGYMRFANKTNLRFFSSRGARIESAPPAALFPQLNKKVVTT